MGEGKNTFERHSAEGSGRAEASADEDIFNLTLFLIWFSMYVLKFDLKEQEH